jgi:hypothetical protein
LNELFAKVYTGWGWSQNNSEYQADKKNRANYVYGADKSDATEQPPIIAGAVLSNRQDATGRPKYDAILNKLAINNVYEGDITVTGEFIATANFFAWADDNQMPLKKVTMDWLGDGRTFVPIGDGEWQSKIKNHKPRCQHENDKFCQFEDQVLFNQPCSTTADCTGAGKTCVSALSTCYIDPLPFTYDHLLDRDSKYIKGLSCATDVDCSGLGAGGFCSYIYGADNVDRFGDTAGTGDLDVAACEEGPFIMDNIFECPLNHVGFADCTNTYPGNTKCWNVAEKACQYIPRVQVKDNWGWCNGDCTPPTGSNWVEGSGGCYGNQGCDQSMETPWTYFSGKILVKPRQ